MPPTVWGIDGTNLRPVWNGPKLRIQNFTNSTPLDRDQRGCALPEYGSGTKTIGHAQGDDVQVIQIIWKQVDFLPRLCMGTIPAECAQESHGIMKRHNVKKLNARFRKTWNLPLRGRG